MNRIWNSVSAALRGEKNVFISAVVVFAAFSLASDRFLETSNILDIVRLMSINMIIAIGMTMIIILGEIDLSPGSLVAMTGMTFGYFYINKGFHPLPALAITLALGAASGLLIATLRNVYLIPSFITSLGLLSIWRGSAHLIQGSPIGPFPQGYSFIATGYIFHIPVLVYLMLAFLVLGVYLLNATSFGRYVYAIGSSEKAARYAGVPVERVRMLVFMFAGALTGVVGVLQTSNFMQASPIIGHGLELNVIAGVIVGGASMSGGRGSLSGTFVGVLIIEMIGNGMGIMGVSSYSQYVVKGLVVLLAVLLNSVSRLGFRGVSSDIA